ncbi:unnamed protein product [Musa acuminata subsp. malaccensis]|uniref:(wild Malaysian banana) hypothetical protein n=1 Tax=Musa acuminata subsp. malaccensis TaxID=214687 RepID=A0A804JL24_MUSAM|nr:unnamed protein product [Musa acuminata subsp. malaccensis]
MTQQARKPMQSQLIAQGEDEMRALHSGRREAVVPRNPDLRFNSTTKTCCREAADDAG